jgi:hypothetical protein
MSASSFGSKRPPVAAEAATPAKDDKQLCAGDAKAAIARTLKKMAADSNTALFSAEAAQAAFGKIRRASR